jgi:hypothetical protein
MMAASGAAPHNHPMSEQARLPNPICGIDDLDVTYGQETCATTHKIYSTTNLIYCNLWF